MQCKLYCFRNPYLEKTEKTTAEPKEITKTHMAPYLHMKPHVF